MVLVMICNLLFNIHLLYYYNSFIYISSKYLAYTRERGSSPGVAWCMNEVILLFILLQQVDNMLCRMTASRAFLFDTFDIHKVNEALIRLRIS